MKHVAKWYGMVLILAGSAGASDEVKPSKAVEERPGCFAESARISPELVKRLPKTIAVEFTVTETGRVQDVSISGVESAVAMELRAALARCDWKPAADASGNPKSVRVEMPVRFERGRVIAARAAEPVRTAPPVAATR